MERNYTNIDLNNVDTEHLCCIIRRKKDVEGIILKKEWLKKQINNGHIFHKLDVNKTAFIEFAPLEYAYCPIKGNNYLYIYCLWVDNALKGNGIGKELLDYAINYAANNNKSGLCLLNCNKKKNWLTNKDFFIHNGFKVVDSTNSGYQLLALSFNDENVSFLANAKKERIDDNDLVIYYTNQCPYITKSLEIIKTYCESKNISYKLNEVKTIKEAKELPCVFNNFAVFYNGEFKTVNLLDLSALERIIKK